MFPAADGIAIYPSGQLAQVEHLLALASVEFGCHYGHAEGVGEGKCRLGRTCGQGVVNGRPCCGGVGCEACAEAQGLVEQGWVESRCAAASAGGFWHRRAIGRGDAAVRQALEQSLGHRPRSALTVVGDAFHHRGLGLGELVCVAAFAVECLV